MSDNLCLIYPENVTLMGTSPFLTVSYLQMGIYRCKQSRDPNCVTKDQFYKSLDDMYRRETNFFSFYLKDTTINAKKLDPIE